MKNLLLALVCSSMLFSCSDDDSPTSPDGFTGNVVEYFPIPTTQNWIVEEWDEFAGTEYDTIRVEGQVPVQYNGETINMYEISHTVDAIEVLHYYNTEGMQAYFPDGGAAILFLPATLNEGVTWTTSLPPLINWAGEVTNSYSSLEITTHRGYVGEFNNVIRVYLDMGDDQYSVSYFVLGIGMVYQEQFMSNVLVNSSTMKSHNGNDIGWMIP